MPTRASRPVRAGGGGFWRIKRLFAPPGFPRTEFAPYVMKLLLSHDDLGE
ncbi:hypothetical protein MAA5396_03210 [Marinovum algicola]|uniref:Uncharacterized protein n=1 Tax=Marinovum algicola TaxID=42444 RepID=A0A975WBG1_9RHOB|nr:hypothetical protein SAMN04487940_11037 [Marinovum algicola]SLN60584.1 hypothetical protein MAA5396_03210 [Marinovum algicola]